jgi:hypothetical protein
MEHQSSGKVKTTKAWNENYPHLALLDGSEHKRREKRSLIVI